MKRDISVIRESIGRIVSMLTEKSIKVTQQGVTAYVKYHPVTLKIQRVNIPYIHDDATEEFIAAVQGFLDHEVGHVLYSDQEVLFKIKSEPASLKNLDNLIEDVYIERKMSEKFSGSSYNLEQVRSFFLTKITAPAIVKALSVGDTNVAKAYAIVAAFRAWAGQPAAMDFIKEPAIAPLVSELRAQIPDNLIARLRTVNNSWEVLELAREIHKAMSEHEKAKEADKPKKSDKSEEGGHGDPSDADSEPGGDDTGEKKSGGKKSSPDKGKSKNEEAEESDSETGAKPGDSESKPDAEATDEKESEDGSAADSESKEQPPEDSSATGGEPNDSESEEPEASSDADFDEGEDGEDSITEEDVSALEKMLEALKDFDEEIADALSKTAMEAIKGSKNDYHVFSNEWDEVEPAPKARGERTVSKLDELVRDKIGVMSKNLERGIAAQAKKAWDGGQRKGRVAPGALFKTAVGDDRVFRKRYETKAKNTAISLVVDCSGSMSGNRIKLAGQAAYGIASVLERLRIPFEVIGFTTGSDMKLYRAMKEEETTGHWGRIYPLYLPVFKSFGEKFNADSKSRIGALTENPGWLAENVDGECVKIAARRLAQQKTERHVMIVLSDGSPACPGGSGGNWLLSEHLKDTVKELEAQKIETIGIGIQTDCVKRYYPKSVVINNIEELPTATMKELTKLLLA